jgi:hypothetical protein
MITQRPGWHPSDRRVNWCVPLTRLLTPTSSSAAPSSSPLRSSLPPPQPSSPLAPPSSPPWPCSSHPRPSPPIPPPLADAVTSRSQGIHTAPPQYSRVPSNTHIQIESSMPATMEPQSMSIMNMRWPRVCVVAATRGCWPVPRRAPRPLALPRAPQANSLSGGPSHAV